MRQKVKVKFLVFTDLHVDIMPDAVARMQVIIAAAAEHGVDFMLQLGDMMYPDAEFLAEHAPDSLKIREDKAWFVCDRDDEKITIKKMIKNSGIPLFSVLGNHDMDSCSKETACAYFDLPSAHYFFDRGGIRFIVLDTNFIRLGNKYLDFDHCNYSAYKTKDTTWLNPLQFRFLNNVVMTSPYPCILLSHSSFSDELHQVHNRDEVYALIRQVNQDKRRIVLALNGHSHVDGVSVRESVPFVDINSASNIWIGHKYDCVRYSETISRIYPHIKGTAPYWDAVFAIIEIDDTSIRILGRNSNYVGPSPYELGFRREESYHVSTPGILSRILSMAPMTDNGHPEGFKGSVAITPH
jgi:hypothetical protein